VEVAEENGFAQTGQKDRAPRRSISPQRLDHTRRSSTHILVLFYGSVNNSLRIREHVPVPLAE
jgi:hypothetical protein